VHDGRVVVVQVLEAAQDLAAPALDGAQVEVRFEPPRVDVDRRRALLLSVAAHVEIESNI